MTCTFVDLHFLLTILGLSRREGRVLSDPLDGVVGIVVSGCVLLYPIYELKSFAELF